jgi:hypothetical protein
MAEYAVPDPRNEGETVAENGKLQGGNHGDGIAEISEKTVNMEINEEPNYLHGDWIMVIGS